MPREAFNNLKLKKKKQIFLAAKAEFTKNSYEDVSICQVIKEAKISRASFYLYFENKLDLYCYVLSYNRKKLVERFVSDISLKKGIFEIYLGLFDELVDYLKQEDPMFIEKTILNLNPQIILYFISEITENTEDKIDFSIIGDYDKLNISTKQDFRAILEMLTALTITKYSFILLKRYSVVDARRNLLKKFEFIKDSIYK